MTGNISVSGFNRMSLEQRRLLQEKILEFRRKETEKPGEFDIQRKPRTAGKNIFPASYAQEQAWFLHQMAPESPSHNVSFAIRFSGVLDISKFVRSLNCIISRHEVLRTAFQMQEGELKQVVDPALQVNPEIVDLGSLDAAERQSELKKRLVTEARVPFDLSCLPLLRVKIFRCETNDNVVLFTVHHIVWDGWSIGVFSKELTTLYTHGEDALLPQLSVQYGDYAVWQREWLDEGVLDKQITYWQQILDGKIPVLEMPLDRPRPKSQTYNGAVFNFRMEPSLSKLKGLGQTCQATLFMSLLAAFKALLFRYTGQKDLIVATHLANRHYGDVEGLVGYFVNQILLRTKLSGEETFEDLLKTVKTNTTEAYAHQDVPLDKIISRLDYDRSANRPRLFQVMFVLQNAPKTSLDLGDLKLSIVPIEQQTANLDLHFSITETEGVLHGTIEYNTDIFDAQTIQDFAKRYEKLLLGVMENSQRRLGDYPLFLDDQASSTIKTKDKAEGKVALPVLELFREMAQRFPEVTAIAFAQQKITYAELDERSSRLAARLQEAGVGAEVPVGICLERSPELVEAILAVLKAGGAFVPLDPGYPEDRLDYMLNDSSVPVLITHSRLLDALPRHLGQDILIDAAEESAARKPFQSNSTSAKNLAYIIYTSGSSGKPKGVWLEQQGLANVAAEQARLFQVSPRTKWLQFASASFDASVFEIVMALTRGATLVLGTKEQLLPGPELTRFLTENQVDGVTLPPSSLALLNPQELPDLKLITVAGEACSENLASQWGASRRFFNLYGPTETTIWATACAWNASERDLSIGKAIQNTEVLVLDAQMQPVPAGIAGEIYIAGMGVARGYVNAPELTAEKFVPHPFSLVPGQRLYKTGDIGRYRKDGNIEFVGRADNQVKIRGFRIEIAEIESTIRMLPNILDVAVVPRRSEESEHSLVAYIIPDVGTGTNAEEVRDFLKTKLPDYMVPSAVVVVKSFPTTPNGKVDRQALSTLGLDGNMAVEGSFVLPRNPVEEKLVEIWRKLLKVEKVGVKDDFFKLGGYSLLAVQIITEVYDAFGVEIPVRYLFTMQLSVEEVAKYVIDQGVDAQLPAIMKELEGLTDEQARDMLDKGDVIQRN